jgi:hypothetical protein
MMKNILILSQCLFVLQIAHAFSLSSRISASNSMKKLSSWSIRLYSDNINDFASKTAAPTPSASSANDDLPPVDFDQLSAESAAQAYTPKSDLSEFYVKNERKGPREAGWLPFLLAPEALDGTYAGDVGFDPLRFCGDKDAVKRYREAELKHSRLAMLAAVGWPMSELWHKQIASVIGLDSILADEGRAPSILNGGLINEWIIATAVFSLILSALLEYKTFAMSGAATYRPGELGFDPLNLYPIRASFGLDQIMEKITIEEKRARARFEMELCEIKHGRLAMLAITADAAQEYLSGIPVVLQTPFFFGDPIL